MSSLRLVFLLLLAAALGLAPAAAQTERTHTVQPKETFYGISRQYGIALNVLPLRRGAKGAQVTQLQRVLKETGNDPGKIDGDWLRSTFTERQR
ncbi:MAG: PGRP and LysM peptidoglycan-binding domain-containing protein, partial [Flavobacteriales bacterium]